MDVIVCRSAGEAAARGAGLVADALRNNPALVLGLPTGRTSIALYRALVGLHQRGQADFARAATFNLDEFLGIPATHAGSYHRFMHHCLFDRVNLRADRIHMLNGAAPDWEAEAETFEARLTDLGGLDLALVGIGDNGHLAFNEPAPALAPRTHRERLRPMTRRANAAAFGGDWRAVPPEALTMGMATILSARRIVLLATGQAKARIVRRALTGPITTQVPSSLLQGHPHAVALLDRAAAAGLSQR